MVLVELSILQDVVIDRDGGDEEKLWDAGKTGGFEELKLGLGPCSRACQSTAA
jgi:hypothetical protein